ncbi:MAG: hypothetical protein DRI94_00415 [Bacteroidetes bacterium]|nr:MAG: hypothetical protein DRI94_00415 [Bacteroidota bacterium]
MKFFYLLFVIVSVSISLTAQNDTISNKFDDDLLNDLSDNSEVQLLPDKFLVTQKILWGQKGLMRNFKAFELTPENRTKELKIRGYFFKTHQTLGMLTSAGMIAQGIIGTQLYNGKYQLRDLHEGVATGVNILYFTTASLALFAPPKIIPEHKGYSSIKIHRALAIIHLSSMIATNVLSFYLEDNPNLRPYHRAAAFTAFGSFLAAEIIIKF